MALNNSEEEYKIMRDNLCVEEKCRKSIKLHQKFIKENREDIKSLEEDERNGIQKFPNDNISIIEETYLSNFIHQINDISAKYSLGDDIRTVEADFHNAIDDLEHTGKREVGYVNMLLYFAREKCRELQRKIQSVATR